MRLTMPIALVVALIGSATPAHADGLLTPFVGVTFGGDTTENKTGFGASLAAMGGGVIGFEIDVSRTPGFFGDEDVAGKNNLTTLTGNLVLGIPLGVVRPYVVGGAGLLRSSFDGPDGATSDLGVDVGGGILGFFGEHVGIRGELRYFRNVTSGDETVLDFNLGDFDFWRASLGIALRF